MKPPEEVARELAREWLVKADVDLSAARALLSTGGLYEVVAFHAQQAAEKALKAFLVWHQTEFPKTHDISRLITLSANADESLAASVAAAAELTPYGVEYRYPGEYPPVTSAAAAASLTTAESVVGAVSQSLRGDAAS